MRPFLLLAAAGSLSACTSTQSGQCLPAGLAQPAPWRTAATADDRVRLREWRDAWVEGLEKARRAGNAAEIGGEGALLDPDGALPFEPPPPGDYRCRTIKLGAKSEGLLDYVAYSAFACRISGSGDALRFDKTGGSQRPTGLLYRDPGERMIFLGTLLLGDEVRPIGYGHDRERDMAGILERIGGRRWRIAFPRPHFESTTDVIELAPAS